MAIYQVTTKITGPDGLIRVSREFEYPRSEQQAVATYFQGVVDTLFVQRKSAHVVFGEVQGQLTRTIQSATLNGGETIHYGVQADPAWAEA